MLFATRVMFADGQRVNPFAMAKQPARKDARVVKNKAIAGPQILGKTAEQGVFPIFPLAIQHQHSGSGAIVKRLLSDAFLWQVVVEVADVHRQAGMSVKAEPQQLDVDFALGFRL